MGELTRNRELFRSLRRAGVDVKDDAGSIVMYSSDASLYRVPPIGVARPRSADEVATIVAAAERFGVPVTARGGGTSIAGNAIGRGLVLDFSRHFDQVLEVDIDERWARVQPGLVQAEVQKHVRPHGLRFGPDPSTHTRCTIGGMIGNNACGSHSLVYGRTSDNVLGLEVVGAGGKRFVTGYDEHGVPTLCDGSGRGGSERGTDELAAALRAVASRHLSTARTEFARFGRQVSGYAAEHLLPENKLDLTKLLVGSEGTLGIVTEATLRLVPEPLYRVVVAIGFADIASAADAAPAVLVFHPTACEGLDARIVDVVRSRRGQALVPDLPRGNAWLFVEISDDDAGLAAARAHELAAAGFGIESRVVTSAAEAAALWRIREAGAGLAGRAPSGLPAWAGWEDSAVPPAALGAYLREFDELVARYGMSSMPYGHFGDGCVHVRLDYPLGSPGGTDTFREFVTDAADLVARFGGSLSGEHGDGRARSELLGRMYSADAMRMFAEIKHAFDPGNVLNPGVLVGADSLDAGIRVAAPLRTPVDLMFGYTSDNGDFAQAVHRCTGVGSCRADNSAAGGVMCPSFGATREEKDSTRGRARVLEEVIRGDRLLTWKSPEVEDALDLCLSCKGCASDCPTGVDMAAYKSEALQQRYRRRLRPRSHYSVGQLPRWSRLARHAPALANLALRLPGIRRAGLFAAGVDSRRTIPPFAHESFREWFRRRPAATTGVPVLLFVDSFTNHFEPKVAKSMVAVLESAGFAPQITEREVCCGLTWITTGQLTSARAILTETVDALQLSAAAGMPIVGIEPSCTAVLRSDAVELLGSDAARSVARATTTLAELLTVAADAAVAPGGREPWVGPDLSGTQIVAQPHCHHHAVMGWNADQKLLESLGAEVSRVSGCCGLAGNFGLERGHYKVSVAIAEQNLLPAVAGAPENAVVLADGFSCRTQLDDLAGVGSVHLAELLEAKLLEAKALESTQPGDA
ncbi:FAD-binding and (Fe-S)-binding domain-containing protein [Subtercola endophyticus]|uniref:FAD-binding and (Fe-S)-binding domain-containing protein n=1 Tax=Subtercola endophyticus TaxID=2895559 RepID=UPI001E61D201|nr:FAD-binding and (Fe-S)-binding domain-containing protein [Subtercola endophyticus]UFS58094.1 FAD-binding protein [Subtercola endophyticus]